jgi:hypothetical protein
MAYPAIGWVRTTAISTLETMNEMNDLRKRISELEAELESVKAATPAGPTVSDLVPLGEKVSIRGTYRTKGDLRRPSEASWSTRLSWLELFSTIAPQLLLPSYDLALRNTIADLLLCRIGRKENSAVVSDFDFDGLKVQLMAYGLVHVLPHKTSSGDMRLFWKLTSYGEKIMLQTRSIRQDAKDESK